MPIEILYIKTDGLIEMRWLESIKNESKPQVLAQKIELLR